MRMLMALWVLFVVGFEYFNLTELRFESFYGVSASNGNNPLIVNLTLIQGAATIGAVCLDGTLPGYHFHRGYDLGANRWLILLEGGAWCNDTASCVYRKMFPFGSSTHMEKQIPFTGILSNKAEENPDFYNWNRVKVRYCDGASFAGDSEDKGVQKNLPRSCTENLDPISCFFPENLIANVKTPLFILNAAYDSWQVQASLAPASADPSGSWRDCKLNHASCSESQIQFLQDFRNHMLNAIERFSTSEENGLFINSCFAHCQTERQDTWFADDSPLVGNKGIALSVGDWYFDRSSVKAIDCAYPCDKTCHNLIFK